MVEDILQCMDIVICFLIRLVVISNYKFFILVYNYICILWQFIVDFLSIVIIEDDLEEIWEKVGVVLYIIQEFYSNINWIEFMGNKIYEDFGQFELIESNCFYE